MTSDDVKRFLQAHGEARYARFAGSLIPGGQRIVGVRLPLLRALARDIVRGDWRDYLAFATDDSMEEVMLQGFVVGAARMPDDEAFERVAAYVRKITNWSLCDSPVTSFTFVRRCRARGWAFLQPYLDAPDEFGQRFGAVMLLAHFVTDEYVERVVERLDRMRPTAYYARMGVAWALSVCFVKYPELTWDRMRHSALDGETLHAAWRKIRESRRTPAVYIDRMNRLGL